MNSTASTATRSHSKVVSRERFLNLDSFYYFMRNSEKLFEDFMYGIKTAGEKIKELNPDFLLVNLNGGLPLYDCLRTIDREFDDPNKVIYFPSSSRIKNSGKIIRNCWENFFIEKLDESDKKRRIVSLDERLGGGSICRTINGYHYASRQMARRNLKTRNKETKQEAVDEEARKIRERLEYMVVALAEERPSVKKSHEYKNYLKEKTIIEVPVEKIITLDNKDFQIISWAHPKTTGWSGQGYRPYIAQFIIKTTYLDLLKKAAAWAGLNPVTVDPKYLERIRSDCAKYAKKPPRT